MLYFENSEVYKMIFIGIDGCKAGWLSVSFQTEEILVFKNMKELVSYYQADFLVFIDIPIGLAGSKIKIRNCEKEARKLLKPNRKSSIFPVPCRESLKAQNYEEAKEMNRKILGCGISKQTWFIIPKIKEVDTFLIENRSFRSAIKESHPEICFQFLNKGVPLEHSKKTEKGIAERLEILMSYNKRSSELFKKALQTYMRKEVAKDDIIDAMCLAISAKLSLKFGHRIPSDTLVDEFGIEMAIHYAAKF